MKGKFYGIGVGPGDPELITLKAINILHEIDMIVSPEARANKGSFAYEIAAPHLPENLEELTLVFPMIHDRDELEKKWKENAEIIAGEINKGKDVAFLTLGDPCVYSTYMYIVPHLQKLGVEIETIPGITSFCSVAAKMNLPLATWEETFGIVPLREGCESAEKALDSFDNVVIMKPSHDNALLAEKLEERGLADKFVMISKCSTEEQIVTRDINDLKGEKVPYLSTIIVKRKGF